MIKHPRHTAFGTKGTAIFIEDVANFARCAIAIISLALDDNADLVGAEAFIGKLFDLRAVIKEAGYGFDGIPAAWAGVMGNCRPAMLGEVTCPVLLVNGQLDQLRVDVRRYARAAVSARWVRVVTVRHGLHVFPLTHPHETATALWELVSAARGS